MLQANIKEPEVTHTIPLQSNAPIIMMCSGCKVLKAKLISAGVVLSIISPIYADDYNAATKVTLDFLGAGTPFHCELAPPIPKSYIELTVEGNQIPSLHMGELRNDVQTFTEGLFVQDVNVTDDNGIKKEMKLAYLQMPDGARKCGFLPPTAGK